MTSVREWMDANGIRVFAVTRAEFIDSWQYHAEHNDGRTRSYQIRTDDPATDSYVLDTLAREFRNDEVTA